MREYLEQEAAILQELQSRRSKDPMSLWRPFRKQAEFVRTILHEDIDEAWYLGANRTGKTESGCYCGASLARFGTEERPHEPTMGWVVSADYPSSRDIVQPRYFNNPNAAKAIQDPFIPDHEIKQWRSDDQILILKNGSSIGFKSSESGYLKFPGVTRDWVHFDEPPPKQVYNECVIRIGGGRKMRVFGTCTLLPEERSGHASANWIYTEKVEQYSERIKIFNVSIYDNPYLMREEIERLERIYPEGSMDRRIRLDGELLAGMLGNVAYGNFDRQVHVVDYIPVHARYPLCWFWDFNVDPLVSGVGQYIDGVFYVIDEFIKSSGSIPYMVEAFRNRYPTHTAPIYIYGDATSEGRDVQTGRSDFTMIRKLMQSYPAPIKMRVPEKNPPVKLRINSVNNALSSVNGLVAVKVSKKCTDLIADFQGVMLDNMGGIKKTTRPSDPYSNRTHISDAFGYWICYEAPIHVERQIQHSVSIKRPYYGFSHA